VVHLPDVRLRRTASPIPIERITHSVLHAGVRRSSASFTIGTSKQLGIYHPQQIEFDRLNLTYTLVKASGKLFATGSAESGSRFGTIRECPYHFRTAARRGYTPRGDPQFLAGGVGVSKTNGITETRASRIIFFREDLNKRVFHAWMAVLRPLRLVIDKTILKVRVEHMEAGKQIPRTPAQGTRQVPSPGCCTSNRTIFARIRPSNTFRLFARTRGSGCGMAYLVHLHQRPRQKIPADR